MAVPGLTKILCVDDEPMLRALAEAALKKLGGFTVRLCASGEEALAAAPAFKPDFILLDMMMPGLDGCDTLAALRRIPALAATPAALMTTEAQARALDPACTARLAGLITKPFEPKALVAAVEALWATRHVAR